MKRFLYLTLCVCFATSLVAQESLSNRESLVGYWVLEKAVLTESALNNTTVSSEKVFTFDMFEQNNIEDHFLLASVITAMKLYDDDDDPSAYVKTPFDVIMSPIVKFEGTLLLVYRPIKDSQGELMSRPIAYQVKESSENQLVLTSGEIFYNDKNRVSQKGEIIIYLNR